MSGFDPEIGQRVFGQPPQRYDVSPALEEALAAISNAFEVVHWSDGRSSPFGNNGPGASYQNDVFDAIPYSWDDRVEQPYNFAWRDLRVSWYKYFGRSMSANMEVSHDMTLQCMRECFESLFALVDHPTPSKEP